MATYDVAYHKNTFHRNFENTAGYLKPEDFPPVDWADQKQLEMLFPDYQRELLAYVAEGNKLNRNIEIDGFSLRTWDNSDDLFKMTKLYIEPSKKCALFGINGSGKTSLFNAISSKAVKHFPKWLHVHHMKELEHDVEKDKVSVLDTVLCSHPFRRVLLCMEEHLKVLIEAEQDEQRKAALSANLDYVFKMMKSINGYTGEKRASQMLRVLGFDEVGEVQPVSSLSGGLRMRVALASAFFIDPELLLLDEPTNHLDMPSVLWLENKLRGYKGAYILVTHDRTLLENVVTSVMLIQDLQLEYFDCGFKEFEKRKETMDEERDKKIDRFLKKNRNIDPSTALYKTKVKYQEWQQKRHERKMLLSGKFTFQTPKPLPAAPGADQSKISLINMKDVRFSYDVEKGLPFIFDTPVSYEVKIGTRVGVMGPNGAGKSTWLKLITGKLVPTDGTITTNPDYTLAYFGQHSTKELSLDKTPLEFMIQSFPKANQGELKSHLEKTSIAYGPMNSRMSDLSFSQRSCVIFAKLTFVPPHLLIMDEPTNFLDLESVDSLIRAVNKFKGGLITVTHNRDFLKRCSKHFLSIVPGAFLEFDTMKEAERATYSFISALESGKAIDVKNAIVDNRGGGAIHTEEYLAASKARLTKQQMEAQAKADEEAAEEARLAAIQAEKEAKRAAKKASQKLDWVAGEECFAPVKGKFKKGVVVRNVPGMGVTVQLESGKNVMVEAKKLKLEDPEAGAEKPAPKKAAATAGGASAAGAKAGRGGARGGAQAGRGGARGGARGGRR